MNVRDLHVHTVFSDGLCTPEEMVVAAMERGYKTIGISDHSYTDFDESYCMSKDKYPEYIAEICRLKEKYKDKIEVLCGIEQDYFSDMPQDGFDYVIGSVHYLKTKDGYVSVDESADEQRRIINTYYDGDADLFAKAYFELVSDIVNKTHCDIIGHFDLLDKFDMTDQIFDKTSEKFISYWKSAADELCKTNSLFEINYGAVSRGYCKTPYPAKEMTEYIKSRGGKFIVSSDAHFINALL
ncbi:MAG: histidinol-phosphatase [Clostridia bacterium]|nr:histidinol-phosphatase [Clostridia bacterium]